MPEFDENEAIEADEVIDDNAGSEIAAQLAKQGADKTIGQSATKFLISNAVAGLAPIVGFPSAMIAFFSWAGIIWFGRKFKGVKVELGWGTHIAVCGAAFAQFIYTLIIIMVLVAIIKLITLDFT
ncbi:MAG: hypothetical protein ABH884_03480 [Candidatus Komeilibacteria bacterium]